jgi:hypothetical protein
LTTIGGGILPENLQEAVIDILTTAECQAMWSAAQVRDSQVCIYDRATQARGACNVRIREELDFSIHLYMGIYIYMNFQLLFSLLAYRACSV